MDKRDLILKYLDDAEKLYDDAEKMITQKAWSHGYHSKLSNVTVHPTRESLIYAVALFDSEVRENILRGKEIVRKVISLQDQSSESLTCGIWPWYLEEPLKEMDPPDWNWADFCAKELLRLYLYHQERVGPDLSALIKQSVYFAYQSIIKRNVGMDYTNIAIMGAYVTHVAGELFGFPGVLAYAKDRVVRFYDHVMASKRFSEYNSPTYAKVAAEDLGRMLNDIKDKESLKLINDLHDMMWQKIAVHYHVPTGEWAGPHGRSYDIFLSDEIRAFLLYSTECPEKYRKYFFERRGEAEINEDSFAYTYMNERFTVGTFSTGDFWNQSRAQSAFIGGKENPVAFQVKFLHNMYDYCSAMIHNAHHKNKLLSIINFRTDGGDTHINLDMVKDASIKAYDMRLRFMLIAKNDVSCISFPEIFHNPLMFKVCGILCRLEIHWVKLGGEDIKYDITRDGNSIFFDVIFYSGKEKLINFKRIEEAVCAYSLTIDDSFGNFDTEAAISIDGGLLTLYGDGLSVSSPVKPAGLDEIKADTAVRVPVR
jgi:hypothetical protein